MDGWRAWILFQWRLLTYDPVEWLVLTGDRLLVALLQICVFTVVLLAAVRSAVIPLEASTPVLFVLFALLAANFTLIAIVTSLGQFILSQRLESPDMIRQRIAETLDYRQDVGAAVGQPVLPVTPDAFMLVLFRGVRADLDALEGITTEGPDRRTREELTNLVGELRAHTEHVISLLGHPASDLRHALFVTINTNYETHAHGAWYLQREYAEEFSDRITGQLGDLAESIEHVVIANRLFQAVFIEVEVSELARYLLYIGLPVQLLAAIGMLLFSGAGDQPVVSGEIMTLLVPVLLVAGFTPFFVLSAYIVRLTVVARRTADTFPFSSQLGESVALRDAFTQE